MEQAKSVTFVLISQNCGFFATAYPCQDNFQNPQALAMHCILEVQTPYIPWGKTCHSMSIFNKTQLKFDRVNFDGIIINAEHI